MLEVIYIQVCDCVCQFTIFIAWAFAHCKLVYRLVDKKNARRYDDCITYTFVSCRKALKQAGLDKDQDGFEKLDKTKVGVLVGSGMGGLTVFQDNVTNMMNKGLKKVSPFFIPYAITNMWALPAKDKRQSLIWISCCMFFYLSHLECQDEIEWPRMMRISLYCAFRMSSLVSNYSHDNDLTWR